MNVWIIIMVIFLNSDLVDFDEPVPVLQKQHIASNGSVGICSQAPCIWK